MRSMRELVCLAVASVVSASCWAQCEPTQIGAFGGSLEDVELVGGFAYLGASLGGLQVVDISDPNAPELVANLPELGRVMGVEAMGEVLYVAAGHDGLITLDVSDPARPVLLGSLELGAFAFGSAIGEGLVFVGTSDGMSVVDISDPSDLGIVGSYDAPTDMFRPTLDGEILYASVFTNDVHVLDVSDPSAPALLSVIPTPGDPRGIRVADDRLYLACEDFGVIVVDISDPANPVTLASLETTFAPSDLEVVGDLGFVAMHNGVIGGVLQVVDLTNLDETDVVGAFPFREGSSYRVRVRDGLAYIAGLGGGLHILNVSEPSEMLEIGVFKPPVWTYDVQVHDGIAYLAEGVVTGRLLTLDVSDASLPQFLGWGRIVRDVDALEIDPQEKIAYVVGELGMHVFDVSDPAHPEALGVERITNGASDVIREGDRLYVQGRQLSVFDVTDRRAPEFLQVIDESFSAFDVVGDSVFLGVAFQGLRILDVADPADPILMGEFGLNGRVRDVLVDDQIAYVAVGNDAFDRFPRDPSGLYIIDVADPSEPRLMSFINRPETQSERQRDDRIQGILVHDGVAYLNDLDRGMLVFDVADPRRPRYLTTLSLSDHAFGLWVESDRLYSAMTNSGLHVFDISSCMGCRADVDGDEDVDGEDYFAYLELFSANDARADIDRDEDIDAEDFFAYLDLFAAGC